MNPAAIRERVFRYYWDYERRLRAGSPNPGGHVWDGEKRHSMASAPVNDPGFQDAWIRYGIVSGSYYSTLPNDPRWSISWMYARVVSGIFSQMPAWMCMMCEAESDYPIPEYPLSKRLKLMKCGSCGRKAVVTKLEFLSAYSRKLPAESLELLGIKKINDKTYLVL